MSSAAQAKKIDDTEISTLVFPSDEKFNTYFTGKSAENAILWSRFQQLASSGYLQGEYVFKPGIYAVEKSVDVRGRQRVSIVGEGKVIFRGEYTRQKGRPSPVFTLYRGNIAFENLEFDSVNRCLSVRKRNTVSDVTLRDISANYVDSCIVIDRAEGIVAENWTIENLSVKDFAGVAVRLAGKDTSNIRIHEFYADGTNLSGESDCYKSGIQILQSASNIRISNALIENIVGGCDGRYPQGDGIEIDDKGGQPFDIVIDTVTVINGRDTGFDIKGDNVVLRNAKAIAEIKSQHAFKFWKDGNYLCEDCYASGEFQSYFRLISAKPDILNLALKMPLSGFLTECSSLKNAGAPLLMLRGNLDFLETLQQQNAALGDCKISTTAMK